MDIDANSATLTGAQLGRKGKAFSALFENCKKFPDFGKKSPDYEVPLSKGPCATLTYTETWHARNPGIFRTLP